MNSERPQKPKSDFPETFDNDELEIDVTYEEITPEEQLEIKKRVTNTTSSENRTSDSVGDIWLENSEEDVEFTDFDPVEEQQEKVEVAKAKTASSESTEPPSAPPEIPENINTDSLDPELKVLEENLTDSEVKKNQTATPGRPEIPEQAKTETIDPELEIISEQLTALDDEPKKAPEIPENINADSIDPELDLLDRSIPTSTPDSESAQPSLQNSPNVEQEETTPTTELPRDVQEQLDTSDLKNEEAATVASEPELIADSWLDESEAKNQRHQELSSQISDLEQQKASLVAEIQNLQRQKESAIAQQTQEIADNLIRMIDEGTRELKERKNNLLIDVEKLERRRERIRQEMRTTFAGSSQDLAVRVQGFKEYLVGSLQELATAAEKLELAQAEPRRRPPQREARAARDGRDIRDSRDSRDSRRPSNQPLQSNTQPQFTEQTFAEQTRRIRQLLDKYRTQPDYYGSPWQLRRTFEPIHAEKVQEWFFGQGGRGAIKGMGSRLQNILIASAIISVLYRLYRDRVRILVLVDTPEKLGEWRRGLQDCLGVSRNDFGSNRGIVLFESADILVQRAERLIDDKLLPLIIIDEAEGLINLNLLKFPLWLAFAEKPQSKSSGYLY